MSYRWPKPRELKIYENTNKDGYKKWKVNLINEQGKRKLLSVSRLIVQHFKPEEWKPNLQVDHIDVNSLNNRLDNLRMLTHRQNQQNTSTNPQKDNKSTGYKNICYHKENKRWFFKKMVNGVTHQKHFKTLDEALEYKETYLR